VPATQAVPVADRDATSLRLGAHIRSLRKLRGLTLVQLADATELSHPFLSQLERGLAQPSLGSLRRIAVALETSPIEIIAAADEPAALGGGVEVHRRGEGALPDGFASGTARMLSLRARSFHPMEVEAGPAPAESPLPATYFVHAEEEFLFVVEGVLRVDLDGEAHVLGPRESIYYAGGVRHRWWSEDGAPCRLLVVKQALRGGAGLEHP
jgi:mannose-6-phosphate isomerase-like protein (cupin superfamily)/DNA-binding XRE family transcriptional regulator